MQSLRFCRSSPDSPVSASSPTSDWKPCIWARCRFSWPDVFMFTTYGQGISAGWLEPLNAYYSNKSLTDLGWYDESDLLKTARAFPLWSDGERYAFPITSEAMTVFINRDALAAKDLPVPQTFEELLATAKAIKTNEMSGIAMRAQASGNSSPPAMGFVFS